METCCPTCSASVSGDYAPGDLVDCPACGATFEARPIRAPASADDMLRRAERYAAEQRLREGFDALDRRRKAERFDHAIDAIDRFGNGASKIGRQLLVGVIALPLLLYLLFILWSILVS